MVLSRPLTTILGVCDMSQGADFQGERSIHGHAKIIIALESFIIVYFLYWAVSEYLYNTYFQAYVNDTIQTNFLLIVGALAAGALGLVLGLVKKRQSGHVEIETLGETKSMQPMGTPSMPTMTSSSTKPSTELHPMVAALKAELANRPTLATLPEQVVQEAPPPRPIEAPPPPPPPPPRSMQGTPSTVITGTLPVLRRVNPQDKNQNSNQ
ncbi:MAG TPA: hypothetical protein VFE96_01915 [Candidatus Bathyarchaeia archaeon]|nr:hypothetical protein [Candidatus Bathyarchaeia archaeon]